MKLFLVTLLLAICTTFAMAQKNYVMLGDFTYSSQEAESRLSLDMPLFFTDLRMFIGNNEQLRLYSPLKRQKGIEKFIAKRSDPLYDITGNISIEERYRHEYSITYFTVIVDFTITDLRTGEVFSQFKTSGGTSKSGTESLVISYALYSIAQKFDEQMRDKVFTKATIENEVSATVGPRLISNTILFGNHMFFGNIATMQSRDHYSQKHLNKLFGQLKKVVKKDERIRLVDNANADAESQNLINLNIAKLYMVDGVVSALQVDPDGLHCTCSVILNFTDMRTEKVLKSIEIIGRGEVRNKVNAALDEAVNNCALDFAEKLKTL